MAPLGILTAIVAAIRVGGLSWLRAVVGRARENRAIVEMELMSSTSHEVCELWNGQGIFRTMGRPEVRQIIYLEDQKGEDTFGLHTVGSAMKAKLLNANSYEDPSKHRETDEDEENNRGSDTESHGIDDESAPNISLNLHRGSKRRELYTAALCGIVLQFGMLVFCGFSVYHLEFSQRFPKNGHPVGAYAFLLEHVNPHSSRAGGAMVAHPSSIGKVLGSTPSQSILFLVSTGYEPGQGNEQTTPSAVPSDAPNHLVNWVEMCVKTIASNPTEAFTLLGVFFGLSGFILQFQGLRGMNWSASIAQLHHEMDWLALRIAKDSNFWPPDEKTPKHDPGDLSEHLAWEILTNDSNIACVGSWEPGSPESHSGSHSELDAHKAQYALNIRQRLGQLTNWAGPASTLSIAVADSIEIVLNTLFDHTDHSAFTWSLKVKIGDIDDNHGKIHFKVDKNNGMWEMDATHIEAALSLWLSRIHETQDKSMKEESGNDWLRKDKSLKRKIMRLLGPGGSEALRRDIKWWVGDMIYRDDKIKSNEGNNVRQSSGFAGPAFRAKSLVNTVGFVGVEPSYTRQADDKVDNETSGHLTVVSNVSLESSLAQHVFSSFMWAIVNDGLAEKDDDLVKKLDRDETEIVHGDLFLMDDPETLLSLGLENKVLTGIANAIQKMGLVSLQEAYMCIIPPLSYSRKLPMEAIVKFIRQCRREDEMLGHWERVILVYIKLFQECKTLGTPPSVFQKATAILIHLFMSVSNTLKLRESQKRTDGVEKLGKTKDEILKQFNIQG
ncbi:hypothetical protein BDD12DRAFT_892990 [Trichophaea hybrida]|nr:hypothetical protein BDD12DRAFT_892990 [Trichophaea hybrida]